MCKYDAERADDLAELEAVSRARLHQQGLDRLAGAAGYEACRASMEDAATEDEDDGATHRCPHCGYRWAPADDDWYRAWISRAGEGPDDWRIDCPACGVSETCLEELT
jgi:DNA-directed RNA polymerase subunit RPC12/RpoP